MQKGLRKFEPYHWVVGVMGIEPVTPSMSTRCLKPNTLRLFDFLETFVAFFAVCSRRIVAVRCREHLPFPAAVAWLLGLEEREPNAKDQYGEAGTDGQPRKHRRAGFGWVRAHCRFYEYCHETLPNSLREIA